MVTKGLSEKHVNDYQNGVSNQIDVQPPMPLASPSVFDDSSSIGWSLPSNKRAEKFSVSKSRLFSSSDSISDKAMPIGASGRKQPNH